MTTVVRSHEILIRAPLQKAFDYVSDLTRHPEWSGGELKIEALTPGPIGVGKQYQSRGEVAIQKDRPNTVQITEFESPHKFAFAGTRSGLRNCDTRIHVYAAKCRGAYQAYR